MPFLILGALRAIWTLRRDPGLVYCHTRGMDADDCARICSRRQL
jgi:hypothetical protein